MLAEYKLPAREAVTSVAGVTIRGKRYVAVGTAVFADDDEAHEARLDDTAAFLHTEKGRLLLFKPVLREGGDIEGDGPSWSLDLVAAKDKDLAPVLDIISIHQFLAIATPSKVWILLPTSNSGAVPGASAETSPDPAKLERTFVELDKCTFAFAAQFLAVSPGGAQGRDVLVVGDAMRSVLVLDVDPDSGAIAAHERCMDAHAVRSLAPVRDDGAGVVITDVSRREAQVV